MIVLVCGVKNPIKYNYILSVLEIVKCIVLI